MEKDINFRFIYLNNCTI